MSNQDEQERAYMAQQDFETIMAQQDFETIVSQRERLNTAADTIATLTRERDEAVAGEREQHVRAELALGQVFRLEDLVREFRAQYPMGINPFLDDVYRGAAIALSPTETPVTRGAPSNVIHALVIPPKSDTRPAIGALPCPFCGSTDIHNWASTDHAGTGNPPSWSVMCFGCECEGPHETEEAVAITRWNDRRAAHPKESESGEK